MFTEEFMLISLLLFLVEYCLYNEGSSATPALDANQVNQMLAEGNKNFDFVRNKALEHFKKNFPSHSMLDFTWSGKIYSNKFICYMERRLKEANKNMDHALYFGEINRFYGNLFVIPNDIENRLVSRNAIYDSFTPFVMYRHSPQIEEFYKREAEKQTYRSKPEPDYYGALMHMKKMSTMKDEEITLSALLPFLGQEHFVYNDCAIVLSYTPLQTCQEDKPNRKMDLTEFKLRDDLYISLIRVFYYK